MSLAFQVGKANFQAFTPASHFAKQAVSVLTLVQKRALISKHSVLFIILTRRALKLFYPEKFYF